MGLDLLCTYVRSFDICISNTTHNRLQYRNRAVHYNMSTFFLNLHTSNDLEHELISSVPVPCVSTAHVCRSSYCRCFRDSWVMSPHCILTRPKKSRAPYVSIARETLNKGGFPGASSGPNIFSLFDFKQKLDLPSRDSCCRFWAPQIMARCPPRIKKRISLFFAYARTRTYLLK
jgi:hypothetical protein